MNINSPAIELLKNVNNGFHKKSLSITIKRVFTDVDGNVLIGGAIPLDMRVTYPFYLLGEFDRLGGYKIGLRIVPPPIPPGQYPVKYVTTFISGNSGSVWDIIQLNPLANIQNEITPGDLVHVFVDDLAAPNTFVWIVQQNLDVAVGSVISNVVSNDKFSQLWVESITWATTNTNLDQFYQNIHIVRMDNLGTQNTDSFLGNLYRTPTTALNNLIKIPKKFKIDQYIGVYSSILYTTEQMKIVFNILSQPS